MNQIHSDIGPTRTTNKISEKQKKLKRTKKGSYSCRPPRGKSWATTM